jgi:intein/homing endonuclease
MAWNQVEDKNKNNVCLCVPHFGNVSLEWVDSTYAPFRYIPQQDYDKSIKMARGILNLDSVPSYTPVVVRDKNTGFIDVVAIEDIAVFYGNGTETHEIDNLEVMYRDGSWTDIKYIIRHPFKGVLKRINCVGGSLDVSDNHSVYLAGSVAKSRKNGMDGAVHAGTVREGDRMAMLKIQVGKTDYKKFFFGGEDLAWVYGLFAAEGSVQKNGKGNISISNNNIKLLERAKKIMEFYFNDEFRIIRSSVIEGQADTYALIASSIRIAKYLDERFYTDSRKKRIPLEIINAPRDVMKAFFDGYMTGDGHVEDNGARSFTTNSATLALGMMYIIRQMEDKEFNVHRRKDKQDVFEIFINKGKEEGVVCSRGNLKDKRLVKEVSDIEYDGYLYDFETESHKFVAGVGNFELHNTERNLLVKMALWNPEPNGDIIVGKNPTNVTHVMFLDTDVIMEKPNDVNMAIRMMLQSMEQMGASIVSGVYRAKKKEGFPYAMWMKNPVGIGYVPISSWTGNFVKVDVIGFGFCLLKREVFEKTPYPWFQWYPDPTPSEDFVFCENALKAGFPTYVHCGITLSHIGQLKVTCDSGNVVTLAV